MGAAQQMLLPAGAALTDPSFSSVVQLAHFNGSNGSTTYTNSCSRGNTITAGGGTNSISTTQSKFGGSSLRIEANAIVNAATHADYNYGSSDYTIEWWQRLDAVTAAQIFFDGRPNSTNGLYPTIYSNGSGDNRFFTNNADRITGATSLLLATTWQHIAYSKTSGTGRLFVDGTQAGSNYTDGNTYLQSQFRLGIGSFSNAPAPGYYQDLRITNGVGRYSANFSVPTAAFPNS